MRSTIFHNTFLAVLLVLIKIVLWGSGSGLPGIFPLHPPPPAGQSGFGSLFAAACGFQFFPIQ